MDDISMRKRIVLSAIISMHTLDGEPVGSKTLLAGNIPLGVSSATLRNEMAQLTEIGLLEQPHVSAGRVPTAMGYQYYVHKLLRRNAVSEAERAQIKQQVDGFDTDPDRACEEAAHLLGRVTGLAGIATTPEGNNLSVAHFRLIRVGRYNIAVIAVTSSGGVRTRICRTARELTDDELTRVQAMLNRSMVFIARMDLTDEMVAQAARSLGDLGWAAQPICEAAKLAIRSLDEAKVFVSGTENLLQYRELDLQEALRFLADERQIRKLVRKTDDTVKAFVADETGVVYSDSISVLIGRYRCGNGLGGGIGLVGPLRMNYDYVIPRLQCLCELLSSALIGA